MRTSEWIQAGFATLFAVAALFWPLTARRRLNIALLAVFVFLAIGLAWLSARSLAPDEASILRDWLPVVLMLVPYWQTGQFFTGPDEKIQTWLLGTDRRVLDFAARSGLAPHPGSPLARFARLTMEWAYMLCYPLVPLGLAALYAGGLRSHVDAYWLFVLVPTYLCYAITPFFPALPPRDLESERTPAKRTKSRGFNLWILKHGSIHAISFPSAHVAAALAVALVLLRYLPLAGWVFLAVAFWIAVAAVVGRYHYVMDVVLGAAVTLGFYFAWRAHLIPSTLITAPAIALVRPL